MVQGFFLRKKISWAPKILDKLLSKKVRNSELPRTKATKEKAKLLSINDEQGFGNWGRVVRR